MSPSKKLYETYKQLMQEIADINFSADLLQWDQETYLPKKGNEMRGRQMTTLNEWAHKLFTSDKMGDLLNDLCSKEDLSEREKRNVLLSKEDYEKKKKLPSKFVRQMSEAVNKSFHAWIKARKEKTFASFEAPLHDLIELKKQEVHLLGFSDHPYDALMNEYDKGLTVSFTDELFLKLQPQLSDILNEIKQYPPIEDDFLLQHFDQDKQWKFGLALLKKMHFDFEAGRQDISEHPFTTNFNSRDVRITTRIDENNFSNMTWSCIHEGGHALYEQGLPYEEYGLPLGEACSLSIHESQSRLWENCIGRSLSFWKHHFPDLQKYFPQQFSSLTIEQFYRGINKVSPSLIRTEADELTYHFHVMIRYEIEKKLIEGSIHTKDIPTIWNEFYKKYLGVVVPDDKNGCLQDIHWSHGSFGYFATYSIGSLYAAQLYSKMENEIPHLQKNISSGDTSEVLTWLQQHIYPYGRYYHSDELCKKATGQILQPDYFIYYAKKKFYDIYSKIPS